MGLAPAHGTRRLDRTLAAARTPRSGDPAHFATRGAWPLRRAGAPAGAGQAGRALAHRQPARDARHRRHRRGEADRHGFRRAPLHPGRDPADGVRVVRARSRLVARDARARALGAATIGFLAQRPGDASHGASLVRAPRGLVRWCAPLRRRPRSAPWPATAHPPMPRIFLPQPFAAGATVELPAAASRHVQVLRLQPGRSIELFNGADGCDWSAQIVRIGRNVVEVRIGAAVPIDRELACAVTLALGVPANDRMDAFVEKAGELGATAIQPLVCERSVLRLSAERAEAKRRHWSAVAAAASEQCGRARVTEVLAVRSFSSWLESESAGCASPRIVLSFDRSAVAPASALRCDAASALVLSGPEGGLSEGEESAAVAQGFVRVGLGPLVLRADTAPLSLLAWLGVASMPMATAAPAQR